MGGARGLGGGIRVLWTHFYFFFFFFFFFTARVIKIVSGMANSVDSD